MAELLGSAFLAAVVIGSGIAAQQLSPGNVGLELFENAAATAAGLYAIILMFGPVSGAHFNPVVSFVDAAFDGLRWRDACAYLPAQVAGCIGGAVVANLMFSKAAVSISTHHRATPAHFLSEIVATLGLILVIFALARSGRSRSAPAAVGAYIGAAYFFTSSTSFANPAITVGRMFSNTFAGIAPSSAPSFVAAQIVGGVLAFVVIKALYPGVTPAEASDIIFPHHAPQRLASPAVVTAVRGRSPRIGERRWHLLASLAPGPILATHRVTSRSDRRPMHLIAIGGSDAGISAACGPGSSTPTPRSPWSWPTPTPTSPSAGSPTTSRARSPTGATWPTGPSPISKRPAWDFASTPSPAASTSRVASSSSPTPTATRSFCPTTSWSSAPGPCSVRPPIEGLDGPDALGVDDGVHLLHSMGDTFAVMRTLEDAAPASALIVGAGYIGLEMAEALVARGLAVTQMEQLPEVLPTVDPEIGALVHGQLADHGVDVLTGTTVRSDRPSGPRRARSTPSRSHDRPTARTWSGTSTWCSWSWGCDPTPSWPPRPAPPSVNAAPSPSTATCGPTSRTSSPPATASSPITDCSARPTCRSAPPPTSRDGWPERTPSAATVPSPAASAPRWSRSSTTPWPAPDCGTTKPTGAASIR